MLRGVSLLSRALRLQSSLSASARPTISRWNPWKWSLAAIAGGWSLWCLQGDYPLKRAKLSFEIPVRFTRCAATAAAIVYDYQSSLYGATNQDDRNVIVEGCHQRGADRLLSLAFANGGIYIKLGQHIGQLYHLLPEAYVHTMHRNLLSSCPITPFEDIRSLFISELGQPPEKIFASFDPDPIASASLAQVHVAKDEAGRKLAVKIQHPGLMDSADADIAIVATLVTVIKTLFPSYDYSWLVEEIKFNLPREADFLLEMENARLCLQNLNSEKSRVRGRVTVPDMFPSLSTSKILTMEFIDGIPITNIPELKKQNISLHEIAHLISSTFNEMIFFFGRVHCDPHAANLIVRTDAHSRVPQLVLIDHGLYQEMNETLKFQYASLWKALIFGDEEGIRRWSEAMNAGELYPIFAAMLTYKEWDDVIRVSYDHLEVRATPAETKSRQKRAKENAKAISEVLLRVPREMRLLLKTNDCLRTIDQLLEQVQLLFGYSSMRL